MCSETQHSAYSTKDLADIIMLLEKQLKEKDERIKKLEEYIRFKQQTFAEQFMAK